MKQITFDQPSASLMNKICNYEFYGCSSLTQITIPSNVTSIGSYAFSGCSSLTQITIPSSTTEIGNWAFKECSSLEEIKIPTTVRSVGDNCFDDCQKLEQVTINPFYTKIQFNTYNSFNKSIKISTARDAKSKTNEHILIPYGIKNIKDFFKKIDLSICQIIFIKQTFSIHQN